VTVLYTIGILFYSLGVRIAALFGNVKAMQWVKGRKHRLAEPQAQPSDAWIWFHAASLGEFEQGRPVIEALKQEFPQYKILLSFFSPSGYEVRKDYPLADEVLYLPSDTPGHAAQWVKRHHFVAAFFIKYEFWFNYMRALKDAGIPLFYISLILNPDSYFFRWYGVWFCEQLKSVRHFFVQDDATAQLLQTHGMTNVTVCGDTRFDRVAAIARQAKPFPEVERFIGGRRCIIAGSTWPPDEKLLVEVFSQCPDDYCFIVAPHDISASHVAQVKALFPDSQLYSALEADQPLRSLSLRSLRPIEGSKGRPARILILNTIGILSQLYQYARFVYIGGGFGVNIHNIQEPVTFGCPVVFGPKYKSFKEAVDLVALEGAFSIGNEDELAKVFMRLIDDEAFYAKASETCRNYLKAQVGATDSIIKGFKKALF